MSNTKYVCITNRHLVSGCYEEKIRQIAASNVDLIILREKDLPEEAYLSLAEKILSIIEEENTNRQSGHVTLCVLHSFVEVAKRLQYPHIHLSMDGFRELSAEDRAWFQTIGVSTHSLAEALEAEAMGATYVTASHIFPTDCKKGLAPRGLEYLRSVTDALKIPVYALGGIHPDNVDLCLEAGADGVCMMSEYMRH